MSALFIKRGDNAQVVLFFISDFSHSVRIYLCVLTELHFKSVLQKDFASGEVHMRLSIFNCFLIAFIY